MPKPVFPADSRTYLRLIGASLLLLACPARSEWAEWVADGRFGMHFNDNVNRGSTGAGSVTKSDYLGVLSLTGGKWYQLSDLSRLLLAGYVDTRFYTQYDRFNSVTPRVLASWYQKFGIGPEVPWSKLFVAGEFNDVRSDLWDYWRVETGLQAGKRFSDRLTGVLQYSYEQMFGRANPPVADFLSGRVMDQFGHSFSLKGEYFLTESISITAGYTYRYGSIVSANVPTSVSRVLSFVEAATLDLDTFGQRFWLYRVRGDSHYGFAYASYAVNDYTSLNLGYEIHYGDSTQLKYASNLVSATLQLTY